MTKSEESIRAYLATIGKRGGLASRRELTRQQARQMVVIREAKRAAKKAGKPWPPSSSLALKISKAQKLPGRSLPQIRSRISIVPPRVSM